MATESAGTNGERAPQRSERIPGTHFEEGAGESDERPQSEQFVRARARIARPAGPAFEKVAARSPGAAPPDESGPNPKAPPKLPVVEATLDHQGSVLRPLVERRTSRDADVELQRGFDRLAARVKGWKLLALAVAVFVALVCWIVLHGPPSAVH